MTGSGLMGKTTERYMTLMGEVLVFNLLSRIFYQEPDRDWIGSIIDQEVFGEAPFAASQREVQAGLALLQSWVKENEGGLTDEVFDQMRSDFTRLFLGPGKLAAAPWESVYSSEERLTFQEATLQVRTWYRRFGVENEKLYSEPDDHISLELSFLAHLALQAVMAYDNNDEPMAMTYQDAQGSFFSEHPLQWAGKWCSLVENESRSDFYKGAAQLTRGALAELAVLHGLNERKLFA